MTKVLNPDQKERPTATSSIMGGGEMSERIRNFNWSATPLGPITTWQQNLVTAVNLILQSPAPMLIMWGKEGISLYNDAYMTFAGGKHPSLLGARAENIWDEAADAIRYIITKCHQGESVTKERYSYKVFRNNLPEVIWFDYNSSPILNTDGSVAGVLTIIVETTRYIETEAALKTSEERFSGIFNQSAVGIAETDLSGKFVLVNNRFCQMVGRTEEELYQMRMQDISHHQDVPGNISLFQRAIQEGIPFKIEKRYIRPDGSEIWVSNNVSLIRDIAGKPMYIVAISQDISEQKQAELALQESEKRFSLMADAAPVMIWMGNEKGENLYFNTAWSNLTGHDPETDAGYEWKRIIHPDDLDYVWEIYGKALQVQEHFSLELRVRRYDGQYRLVSCQGSPRRSPGGNFLGFVGICTDITERKLAEKALEESEEHFRTFANHIQNLAWMARSDGWTYWFNQQWYDYTGTTPEEVQGLAWQKVIHPEHVEQVATTVQQFMAQNIPWELTFPLRNANGEYRWFLTRAYPVKDAAGNIMRWIGTNTDIQEQKKAEEELKSKNGELQRINNDLDNFIYTASHDLKAPIANLEGLMDVLVEDLPDNVLQTSDIGGVLSHIRSAINRFRSTINDLTDLTKLQRQETNDESQIRIEDLLAEVCLDLLAPIQESGAIIKTDFSQGATIRFSKSNMRSILYNLLSNAIKYRSPERTPVVRIETREEAGYFILSVADNGLGIGMSQQNKIFSMFKRLHDHVEGSGIGLYIVKKIVENAGGKIEVESEVGNGSCFKVYFKNQATPDKA